MGDAEGSSTGRGGDGGAAGADGDAMGDAEGSSTGRGGDGGAAGGISVVVIVVLIGGFFGINKCQTGRWKPFCMQEGGMCGPQKKAEEVAVGQDGQAGMPTQNV